MPNLSLLVEKGLANVGAAMAKDKGWMTLTVSMWADWVGLSWPPPYPLC